MSTAAAFVEDDARAPSAPGFPPVPETVAETGLTEAQITDLLLKVLYQRGALRGDELAEAVALSFSLIDDLYHQATTIGGREVDNLNERKAAKQEALHTAGFAAATAGSILAIAGSFANSKSARRSMETAGLIAVGVGVLTMIVAEHAIDPSADVRAWTMLPGALYVGVGRAPPGDGATIRVISTGSAGDESQTWTGVPVAEKNNLYWLRLLPGRRGGAWNVPSRPAAPAPQP